jgi:hypothetical protein
MTFERAEAGVKMQETEERTVEVRRQERTRVLSMLFRYDLRHDGPDVVLFA